MIHMFATFKFLWAEIASLPRASCTSSAIGDEVAKKSLDHEGVRKGSIS